MADVRTTHLRFPGWTQHFWTGQTGKALPGQQPLLRHTWASYLAVTLTVFLTGLAVSTACVAVRFPFWYVVLLLGWRLTVTGERMMVLVIAHQALHRRFSGRAGADRFWGETVPARSLPAWRQTVAWIRWTLLTVCYHLPSRLLVVVGDLPNHDYHHQYPSTPEWTAAAYARQRDIDSGPEGPSYQEVWGMGAAIDRLFRSWEGSPADALSHR
jgi:hypothetical protein